MLAIVPALGEKHNITIRWHFFATSHGNGPVDGVDSATKRYVWNTVRTGQFQVTDSQTFALAAAGMTRVKVTHFNEEAMKTRAAELRQEAIFEAANKVGNVRSIHCNQYVGSELRTAVLKKDLDTRLQNRVCVTDKVLISAGQFVTAVYDVEIYIARVSESNGTHAMLSFITPSGLKAVKW